MNAIDETRRTEGVEVARAYVWKRECEWGSWRNVDGIAPVLVVVDHQQRLASGRRIGAGRGEAEKVVHDTDDAVVALGSYTQVLGTEAPKHAPVGASGNRDGGPGAGVLRYRAHDRFTRRGQVDRGDAEVGEAGQVAGRGQRGHAHDVGQGRVGRAVDRPLFREAGRGVRVTVVIRSVVPSRGDEEHARVGGDGIVHQGVKPWPTEAHVHHLRPVGGRVTNRENNGGGGAVAL
ncbi:MAG: hypothetical protein DDT20_01875 [Firmicutes bacterium]|nr:hypothetical protein [Bacillota bacterium]